MGRLILDEQGNVIMHRTWFKCLLNPLLAFAFTFTGAIAIYAVVMCVLDFLRR